MTPGFGMEAYGCKYTPLSLHHRGQAIQWSTIRCAGSLCFSVASVTGATTPSGTTIPGSGMAPPGQSYLHRRGPRCERDKRWYSTTKLDKLFSKVARQQILSELTLTMSST